MQAQFGDTLVLAGGSDNHPQFLQPVLKNLGEVKAFNITDRSPHGSQPARVEG
jgi:hypothetical protein